MADVSVEFGAKDTGLEQTLKTVQDELTRLNEEVKAGELSFGELQTAMRKVSQAEKLQEQLQGMAQATNEAGNAAGIAAPKARELGDTVQDAGNKADGAAGIFDSSFAKISAAFTVGNLAAQGFQKIVDLAFDAARAVVQGFSDAIDLGGRLDDLSKRTGETAGKLLVLENAFVEAGVSADQVGTTINKLQNFMVDAANGGEKQKAAMDNLGISLADLAGKAPTEQMGVFASKIAGIEDPAQRAAAASEVFGEKLGGKLLPLLTEFSPALDKSRESVGSLEEVMDENAATFAAAGDTIDRVKGKTAAFAAGILSETLPALKDLGEGMESVDAAGLGEGVGNVLNPAIQDFTRDIQILLAILNALKTEFTDLSSGLVGGAENFRKITEEANKYLQVLAALLPGGLNPVNLAVKGLAQTTQELSSETGNAAQSTQDLGNAAAEAKPKLDALPGAGEALNLEFENLPQNIQSAVSLTGDFKTGLEDAAASVTPMKGDFSEISTLTAQLPAQNDAFTQSILGTNEQLNLQPGIYASIFQGLSESQAKEEERRLALEQAANKLEASVELQIQLNNAIASGNIEEQERVQKLIDGEAAQKRINTLTEQYIKSGLGKEDAEALAENLVKSEIAARGVAGNTGQVKTNLGDAGVEAQTVKGLMDEIANAKMEASPERLKERTKDAREELEGMKNFIGEDLSKMPLDDIIDKLGLDPDGKLKTTDDKLKAVEGAIKKIGGADPADITPDVDLVGVNDKLESVKGYLAEIGKKKTDATPEINQVEIGKQAKEAIDTIEKTMKKTPAEVALDAKKSIGEIRESLAKEIDLALSSSEGTKHLSSIDKLVDAIKGMVEKIEGKLPMQALAY